MLKCTVLKTMKKVKYLLLVFPHEITLTQGNNHQRICCVDIYLHLHGDDDDDGGGSLLLYVDEPYC
jgi:hypothetical protein